MAKPMRCVCISSVLEGFNATGCRLIREISHSVDKSARVLRMVENEMANER